MRRFTILLFGVGLLSACNSTPTGQVIATVNGQEITREQLNDAMRSLNFPNDARAKDAQNAVLDQLIIKQLVVQAAKQDGLDKTQPYLEGVQNASNALLISLYAKKVAGSSNTPYNSDVDKFIQSNPSRFGDREIITVDQIRLSVASMDPKLMKGVATIDQLAAVLKANNIRFARGNADLDTATLDPSDLARLLKLPGGAPFLVRQGNLALISTIIGRRPAPLSGLAAHDAARTYLARVGGQTALANQLKVLRSSAKINYQTGFAAPRAAPTAAAAAVAAAENADAQ